MSFLSRSARTFVATTVLCTAATLLAQTTPAGSGDANSAGNAQANVPTQGAAGAMSASSAPGDVQFVKKSIMGNNGEIDAANLALQKSNSDAVKQYAQKMVDDHTKMLNDLHTLAQQENITYQDKPTPMAQALHAKLENLSGPAFDKAYINGMVKDHKGDVADFNKEISTGKLQPVKDAASQNLPTIKQHLQMVEALQKSNGTSTGI